MARLRPQNNRSELAQMVGHVSNLPVPKTFDIPVRSTIDSNRPNNTRASRNPCNLLKIPLTSSNKNPVPESRPCLNIVHLNIRSLKNKTHFLELTNFIKSNNIDMLTLSETWLNTSTKNYEIAIEGYKLFRLNRLRR